MAPRDSNFHDGQRLQDRGGFGVNLGWFVLVIGQLGGQRAIQDGIQIPLTSTVLDERSTPAHQLTEGWSRTEFVDVSLREILGRQLGSNIGFAHARGPEHVRDSVV